MTLVRNVLLATLALASVPAAVAAQATPTAEVHAKTFADATRGMRKIDGYVPLYWSDATGKLLMEVDRFDSEFLYQVTLATGVGSNPVGLDRGQLGGTYVVRFERSGPKILLVQSNYGFRALGAPDEERRAVEESFARSVIYGFTVEAEEQGRVLVDATSFFVRDARDVAGQLRDTNQGRYVFDPSRSALFQANTKGFPSNTEVEATVTLVTDGPPGPLVRGTVPSPDAVTVREHHSLVQLPDPGYVPRRLDPRVGYGAITVYDYASPIGEPIEKRWIARHRLEKKDPTAAVSEPVKPIVYYVDSGTPEPVRSALIEGASWWNQAFEAAGFRGAFQVRVLPAGADPMDIRYNMIDWVHRSTRGWAYGSTITDPRTGEIIRGVVTLDSLRARQDYLIFTGLEPSFARGAASCQAGTSPDPAVFASTPEEMTSVALARIRQLSAHEVGHTLGLAHNFAASTYGRASVMDYPAPLVAIAGDRLDLSGAYARGIGEYDKFAIRYGYTQFRQGADEAGELDRIASEGAESGLLFLSDDDARPAGAANPLASLWDNGPDPVASLWHEMDVRRIALKHFGLENVAVGAPVSTLEDRFLPLYLHHRYQLAAAAKSIGGLYYTHTVRERGGPSPRPVAQIIPAPVQRDALAAVLATIAPGELAVPRRILDLLPPRAFGYEGGTAELFDKRTNPAFDALGAASIAADVAVRAVLEPNRAARLEEYHARDAVNPGFREVANALVAASWKRPAPATSYEAAVARSVQSLVLARLIELASDAGATAGVRAIASGELRDLSAWLKVNPGAAEETAHRRAARDDVERFLARPDMPRKPSEPLPMPPGDPIGGS